MAGDVLSAMRAWGRIQGTFDNPQGKDTEEMDEVVRDQGADVGCRERRLSRKSYNFV